MASRWGQSLLMWPKKLSMGAWSVGVPGRPKCWAIEHSAMNALVVSAVMRYSAPVGLCVIRADVDNGERLSPLALPFLSFTDSDANKRYIVFKADPAGRRGFEVDIIAEVPVGRDARRSTTDEPWPSSQPNGWWHRGTVNGVGVEIVER